MLLLVRQSASSAIGSDGNHSEAHIALIRLSIRKQCDEQYAMYQSSRFIENLKPSFESSLISMNPSSFAHIGLPNKDDEHVIDDASSAKAKLIITDIIRDFLVQLLSTVSVIRVRPDDSSDQCFRVNWRAFRLLLLRKREKLNSTNFNEKEVFERWVGRIGLINSIDELRRKIEN